MEFRNKILRPEAYILLRRACLFQYIVVSVNNNVNLHGSYWFESCRFDRGRGAVLGLAAMNR